jgi:glycosyltransferase involved in cell wall biosynthesis
MCASRREDVRPGPLSVCLVCFPYIPNPTTRRGIDRYAYEIVTGLRRNGMAVDVIQGGDRLLNPLEFLRQAISFVVQASRGKGNVIHALDPLGALPFLLARNKPLAVTVHDVLWFSSPHIYDPNPHRIRFYGMRLITRACLARANAIFVPFEDTRKRLGKLAPSYAPKIKVVPYGLTPPEPRTPSSPSPRRPGEGDLRSSMLFIGGDQPVVRGGLVCLRILKTLLNRGIPVRLTFVGSGLQMEAIREEAHSLGMDGSIDFASLIPEGDLNGFISLFDVFVYPSSLGFSFLVLQSMEAGTPVVAADVRELREFISDAGIVWPQNDVEGFANVIGGILTSSERRQFFSTKGTQRAAQFTTQRMTESLIAEYSGLLVPQKLR